MAGGPQLGYTSARQQHEGLLAALKFGGNLSGAAVCDVGCGQGGLVALAKVLGAERALGVDLVGANVAAAADRWGGLGCTFRVGDAEYLGDDLDASFDLVTCVEVLHTVPTSRSMVALWRLVKPGGRLVVAVNNVDSPFDDVAHRRGGVELNGLGRAGIGPALRRLGGLATYRQVGMHPGDDQRCEVFDSRESYADDLEPLSWLLCLVRRP